MTDTSRESVERELHYLRAFSSRPLERIAVLLLALLERAEKAEAELARAREALDNLIAGFSERVQRPGAPHPVYVRTTWGEIYKGVAALAPKEGTS